MGSIAGRPPLAACGFFALPETQQQIPPDKIMNELMIGYAQDTDIKVFNKAAIIHTALTTAPGNLYFPTTHPTMAVLQSLIDALQVNLSTGNTPATNALRQQARDALTEQLPILAAGLEIVANGNLAHLAATGFELKTKPSRSNLPTAIPTNLRLATTGTAGQAMARVVAVHLANAYEGRWTLNPTNGPWITIPPTTDSQKILFAGLERGKDYYFEVRAIGSNGPSGWSDVATMMVI
jgi:hypothetical protein